MRRVLIVDDEVLVRIGIKHSITWDQNGFELIGEASDGKEALEMIQKLAPDIVILDINMPVLNGIEVLRELKEQKYNYNRMITLTDLADYMGLSESYTSRLFNKEVGMNMSSYINEIRVEKAKELLTHSDEKIYGIAEKIGYASTTAFHVAFKKKTGMTPAEYRNQNYR